MPPPSRLSPLMTVAQHIIEQQRQHPTATGQFSWLLSGITLATKIIEACVRRAGIVDVLGSTGKDNVHGESVQMLDVFANETLKRCLDYRGNVGILVSEEDDEPRIITDAGAEGKYIVLFDPLDGSSNIDVNVSVGTIFSILVKRDDLRPGEPPEKHCLQPGVQQLAAGYVVYGSSTVMAYTTGDGVHMFTLNPEIGAYVLHRERVIMPAAGKMYSVNEAYRASFPRGVQEYLDWTKEEHYSLRYIGSLVADFHRTLLRGGVFLYPPTGKAPQGKLRLLYEVNPIAFLAEQAGGMATDGRQRILDRVPTHLHERTPLIVGSTAEVERVLAFMAKDGGDWLRD
jgi:fructose-1,6-bisphosphatase I